MTANAEMKVPQAAREFVKRAASEAKERAADTRVGVEEMTAAIENAAGGSVNEAAKIRRAIQNAVYEEVDALLDDVEHLATAKSFGEAFHMRIRLRPWATCGDGQSRLGDCQLSERAWARSRKVRQQEVFRERAAERTSRLKGCGSRKVGRPARCGSSAALPNLKRIRQKSCLQHLRTGGTVNAELSISGRNYRPALPGIDIARAAELRRVKALANAVLGGSLVILLVARAMAERHPAFGFVAAFAEAAAIGGLADWYAVVALFRRPLGLPIPHTAIIAANQSRMGRSWANSSNVISSTRRR